MKHIMAVIVTLLVSLSPAAVSAQGALGVKGGWPYGNVSNRGLLPGPLDHRTGFAAGIALTPKGHLFGLGVEALYAQRGVSSSTASDSRELNYVDVPVYLRAALPTPGVMPFAYSGPQASFELACRSGTADCPATHRPKTSYAAVLGGGVHFEMRRALSLEGR